ncbi:MAG: creatininase family protein [Acidimicrobiales bacterium]
MRSIFDLAAPDVRRLIDASATAVLPFGSVEQHGPHLPCGTDTMAAELVAAELAERLDALLVPTGPFGVTPIHAGHPGTISLDREVYERYVTNLCQELVRMGVRTLVMVNWHEGNIASLDAVATDVQARLEAMVVMAQACYVAQRLYADRGGELTHGGGIETLAVLAHDPTLVRSERITEPSRPPGAEELDAMRRSREVYGYITDASEIADDGWYGNPGWATAAAAEAFAATVATEVEDAVRRVLAVRRRRDDDRPR